MTNTFTPPPLSLARLDELAAMRAKATQGVWRSVYDRKLMVFEVTATKKRGEFVCIMEYPNTGSSEQEETDSEFIAAAANEFDTLLALAREALRLRVAVTAMGEEFPAVNGRQPQCPECFRLGGYEPHDTDCSRGRFFLKLAYLRGMP